jgi:hypothetical protein
MCVCAPRSLDILLTGRRLTYVDEETNSTDRDSRKEHSTDGLSARVTRNNAALAEARGWRVPRDCATLRPMNTPTFNPRLAIRTTASFLVAVALTATTSGASSQPTCVLPVSAYVTDSAGTPLDGATDLELRFYVESDPDAVAVECRSLADVAVDNGWLRLLVDACADPSPGDCGASPLTDLVTGADALWVGLRIGDAEGELSPRLPIGAAPYAIRAADSDTLDGLDAVEFERAGAAEAAVGTHAAGPDAHHSSTSDGIAITPASATVD